MAKSFEALEKELTELDAKLADKLEIADFNRNAVADAMANLLPLMQAQSKLMRDILERTVAGAGESA